MSPRGFASDLRERGKNLVRHARHPSDGVVGRGSEHDLGDPEGRQLLHLREEVGVVRIRERGDDRLLDRVVVGSEAIAVPAKNVEEVRHPLGVRGGEVHDLRVLRDQAQGLPLPLTADHDRRVGPLDRRRAGQRLLQRIVRPPVGAVVVAPHLQRDLQRLLQSFEPFGQRRERHAQAAVLPVVPRGADAEHRAAFAQDIQARDDLREQPRIPVRHTGHERTDPHGVRVRGEEAEGREGFEHRLLGRGDALHLEPVIHDGELCESALFGGAGGATEHLGEGVGSAGDGEVPEVETCLHAVTLRLRRGMRRGFPEVFA